MLNNTVVSNHFHSVKSFLFTSARPHDFDGMLGTELLVLIYITYSLFHKMIHWLKIFMAEVLMTNFIVENNVLIATADKCGPLLRNMSSDSQIEKQYQYVKTKTVCMLYRLLTLRFQVDLVYKWKPTHTLYSTMWE